MSEEVPAICKKCLGQDQYLKMIKQPQGAQCRLCTRPFTVFKWNVTRQSKFSKTVICYTCARQRNCCQSCMLDLTYGISIEMRDAAFKMAGVENPNEVIYSANDVTKRYMAQKEDRKYANGDDQLAIKDAEDPQVEARRKAEEIMQKLAQAQNRLPLSDSSLKKKPQGRVSKEQFSYEQLKSVNITKILSKLPFNGNLSPPTDTAISSFFLFGVTDELTNIMVTDYIQELLLGAGVPEKLMKFKSITINHLAKSGFITFEKRSVAEKFAELVPKPRGFEGPGIVVVRNTPLRVAWGKVRNLGKSSLEESKVGNLVRKQMKLLAEKDIQSKGGGYKSKDRKNGGRK